MLLDPELRSSVPNAPCGVERKYAACQTTGSPQVPNAPCGVESEGFFKTFVYHAVVPNAPCGVESFQHHSGHISLLQFLMHRVELKAFL